MKFNNLESTIKDKLNERSIQPKENSWDRLDVMLTVAEKQPIKKSWRWLYVAASLIGVLLVVSVYWNRENRFKEQNNTIVIENNTPEIPSENIQEKGIENQLEILKQNSNKLAKTGIESSHKTNVYEVNNKNLTAENNTEIIQQNTSVNKNKELKPVTETDVNLLLAEAQSSLYQEKVTSVKIDALQLLNQVDEPVLLTFKDKALHAITENYKTIQTAVSNRNQ